MVFELNGAGHTPVPHERTPAEVYQIPALMDAMAIPGKEAIRIGNFELCRDLHLCSIDRSRR